MSLMRFPRLLFAFLCCAWAPLMAVAAEPPAGLAEWRVEALRDPSGLAGIAEVATPESSGRFAVLESGILSSGYTRDAWWLRLTVGRQPGAQKDWRLEVEPAFLDDLRLFTPDGRGGFVEERLGDMLPFSTRPLPYRHALFALELSDETPRQYYLRVQTTSSVLVIPSVRTPEAFRAHAQRDLMGLFLFFGMLLAMLMVNLLYAFWLHDRFFSGYALFLLTLLITFMGREGFLGQLFFPEQPLAANWLLGFSAYAAIGSGAMVFQLFVGVGRHFPKLEYFVLACVAFELLTAFSAFTEHFVLLAPIGWLLIVPVSLVILVTGVKEARAGAPGASLVALAYFIHLVMIQHTAINFAIGLSANPSLPLMLGTLAQLLALQAGVIARAHHAEQRRLILEKEARTAVEIAARERHAREAQGQFLSMVAHEVRTPLAVICATSQSLRLMDGSAQPAVAERIDRIERSARRMSALFDLCLDAERIEARQDRPEMQSIFLPALVADMAALLGSDFLDRFSLRDLSAGRPARADPQLLKVAIANLLDNAGKYSPVDKPITAVVEFVRKDGREGVALDVIDSGPGVPETIRERIFEKHFRGGRQSDLPGLGLGLYLSRQICAAHGGSVEVVADSGGHFRIFLPQDEKTTCSAGDRVIN